LGRSIGVNPAHNETFEQATAVPRGGMLVAWEGGSPVVRAGTRVVGYDGVEVGRVVEGDRERLRVRRSDQSELWVAGQAILDANENRVTLICYARGVTRWRLD
jgi:hypothetical protein